MIFNPEPETVILMKAEINVEGNLPSSITKKKRKLKYTIEDMQELAREKKANVYQQSMLMLNQNYAGNARKGISGKPPLTILNMIKVGVRNVQ
ncbi:hypothetical protein AB834_01325 [PVC group bacterium (ex Bugula neritina AB1)]|nr:hypothetical protein AB834_01325 [PVC group bacterium (ex Bugula neritina AB1)]